MKIINILVYSTFSVCNLIDLLIIIYLKLNQAQCKDDFAFFLQKSLVPEWQKNLLQNQIVNCSKTGGTIQKRMQLYFLDLLGNQDIKHLCHAIKGIFFKIAQAYSPGADFFNNLSEIKTGLVRVTQKSLRAAKNHPRRFGKAADLGLITRHDPFGIRLFFLTIFMYQRQ